MNGRPDDPSAPNDAGTSAAGAEAQLIEYKAPDVPPPVTRGERVAVVTGYVLLAGGLLVMPVTVQGGGTVGRNPAFLAALAVTVVGGVLTTFCFIYNAIRRM